MESKDLKGVLGKEFYEAVKNDSEVTAVLLFGSYARGEPYRDIDICIVLDRKYDSLEMSNKKLRYGMILPSKFDISIFQQLPVYIRIRVIKDGKVLFCKNEDKLYELAFDTLKEFDSYEKLYEMYLEAVKNG